MTQWNAIGLIRLQGNLQIKGALRSTDPMAWKMMMVQGNPKENKAQLSKAHMWQAQSEGQLGTYNSIQSKWRNFLNSNSMEVHTRVKQYRSNFSRIWRTYTAAFSFIFAGEVSTGQIFLSTIPYQYHLRYSSPISSQANPTSLRKSWTRRHYFEKERIKNKLSGRQRHFRQKRDTTRLYWRTRQQIDGGDSNKGPPSTERWKETSWARDTMKRKSRKPEHSREAIQLLNPRLILKEASSW